VRSNIVNTIFRVNAVSTQKESAQKNLNFSGASEVEQFESAKEIQDGEVEQKKQSPTINDNKVGRNDPCPCGSGKKYKKCCGK
jgi:uncharacterized protein YecA (UPF0149 family)